MNRNAVCIKHRMADGTVMDGPVHGPGQECVEWADGYRKGGKVKNPRYKGSGRKTAKHFSAGGMLVGPSHDNGGIPVIVDGVEPIEVEGGEFIINKQTVDALGEDFLHKLNSTQTTHHTGGFNEGQLPSPSKFKNGGKVTRRNKMARGRRRAPRRGIAPARRMRRGGMSTGVRKFEHGGSHCGEGMTMGEHGGCVPHGNGGYRRGGRVRTRPVSRNVKRKMMRSGGNIGTNRRGIKKYPHGGQHHTNHGYGSCKMHSSDVTSCNSTPGCHYDYSIERCVG